MRRVEAISLVFAAGLLLSGGTWYKENLSFGLRDSILLDLSFSASSPETMYLATTDGYIFTTHNGGWSWDEARIIVKGKPFFGAIRPTVAPPGVPVCASDALSGSLGMGLGGYSTKEGLYLAYGTVGDEMDMFEAGLYSKAAATRL